MGFTKAGLDQSSLYYLKEQSIVSPTTVQKIAMPRLIEKSSVITLAPTGSGKTLCFALPMMQVLKKTENSSHIKAKSKPRALILSPTRELALQTFLVCKGISHHHKLRVRKLFGGTSSAKTVELANSSYDILVAGPKRLNSAIARGEVDLSSLDFLILDEADQLLDMGFDTIVKKIADELDEKCCVGLFSATMPEQIDEFITNNFGDREFVKCIDTSSHKISVKVDTFNVSVPRGEKYKYTLSFLKTKARGQGIIFCNLKREVDALFQYLEEQKADSKIKNKIGVLHGGLTPKERTTVFKQFKDKKIQVLVSSDIAARGVDFKDLSWVLNYDLPQTPLYYLHRVGRTARQNKSGAVYNFVSTTKRDQLLIEKINKVIKNQLSFNLDEISYRESAIKFKALAQGQSKKNKKKSTKKKIVKKVKKKVKVKKTPRYKRK